MSPCRVVGLAKAAALSGGIGDSPHDAIDGQQLQPGPAGVVGLLVPTGRGLMKQALDALVPELLAGLQEGAGCHEGALAGQQDIELIDELGHGDMAEHGHADDGPDQALHGHEVSE